MIEKEESSTAAVIQQMDIVAMTTTHAAKIKSTLNRLDSKIMIVEEAAEVFEAHIITSLNPNIE